MEITIKGNTAEMAAVLNRMNWKEGKTSAESGVAILEDVADGVRNSMEEMSVGTTEPKKPHNVVLTSVEKLAEIVQAMQSNLNNEYMTDAVTIEMDRDGGGPVVAFVQHHMNDDRASDSFELRNPEG